MEAFLARRRDEVVDVERRDDAPAAFVRRSRRYTVRAVLAHWWQVRPWWEGTAPGPADDEHEIWRVEAVGPAGTGVLVVDLAFGWTTGTWTLTAVAD
jgi:hypothetical protein